MPDQNCIVEYSIHSTCYQKRHKKSDFSDSWSRDWQPKETPLEELRDWVGSGMAFIGARMSSHHRSSSAFECSDLAVVDIDHGLSIKEFLEHPLATSAAWSYTSSRHGQMPEDRFRVVFRLPQRIHDPEIYKGVVTLLIRALGSDKSCSDPCRIFYGSDPTEHVLWQPDARLPESILNDAEDHARKMAARAAVSTDTIDQQSIDQAVFVLEQVLEPTVDGDRRRFERITASAATAGSALFPAWSDWASRGHHGKGKNAKQTTEKFFRGFRGSGLGTLFFYASDDSPDWRSRLPSELRRSNEGSSSSFGSALGYDHNDFIGDPDDDFFYEGPTPNTGTTQGLFDAERPWTQVAVIERPPVEAPPINTSDSDDDDGGDGFGGDNEPPTEEEVPRVRAGRGRPRGDGEVQIVVDIKTRLQRLYPGLRMNSMSQDLEYGSVEKPIKVDDASTAYVRISNGAGQVFPKTLTYDTALIVGRENAYHPVTAYLEKCALKGETCGYFDRIASELLGLRGDELTNPTMPCGNLLADVIMKRFLVGAVARVLEPGCTHDWMPILIGSQNSGKTTFFQYLTPPAPDSPGSHPWVSTVQQGINLLKDRPHILHAGWLVVMDECERYFRRQYTEELKNIVSIGVDRSARKYENERNFLRSFVLAGATNSTDFLVDPTGNRRFMPIVVEGKVPSKENPNIRIIDLDRLKEDRDKIWTSAYQTYLDKPVHTFSSYELSFMKDYMETFQSDSPLEYQLDLVMTTKHSGEHGSDQSKQRYWLMADLFEWLEIPLKEERSMARHISDALKKKGFSKRRVKVKGKVLNMWLTADPLYNESLGSAAPMSRNW